MPDTFREAKKIRSKKKERPFRRERAAYLAGGSARQVAANHEPGSTSRSPRAIGKTGLELSPSSSSLSAAVDSGGASPHLRRARQPQPHPRGVLQNLPGAARPRTRPAL